MQALLPISILAGLVGPATAAQYSNTPSNIRIHTPSLESIITQSYRSWATQRQRSRRCKKTTSFKPVIQGSNENSYPAAAYTLSLPESL